MSRPWPQRLGVQSFAKIAQFSIKGLNACLIHSTFDRVKLPKLSNIFSVKYGGKWSLIWNVYTTMPKMAFYFSFANWSTTKMSTS